VTGKIYTLVSGYQPHTIQIVRAHARDLTMGAARIGLAPGIILYADNILLLAPSASELDKFFKICERELKLLDNRHGH